MTGGATAVVVLNYRTPRNTLEAIASLGASQSPVGSVVLVDNASADGSVELFRQHLPDVRLIVASTNNGFSAGCNLGIREALAMGAERILLLNSDVVMPPNTVGELERALSAEGHLGIVAPIVVSRTDPDHVQSLGISYTASTGRMRHYGHRARLSRVAPFARRHVDGVSGCAMMIRRAVFARVGLLDEAYFFGFEDLDFCLRARAAGFRTACVGTAVVLHEGSVSIGPDSDRRIYFATRNHLLLAARVSASQPFPVRWLRGACIVALNLAHVLFTSPVSRRRGLAGLARGFQDHLAGRYGPPPGSR